MMKPTDRKTNRAALGAGLGRMTAEQVKAWADARKGWAVFFLTARLEDGEIRSGAKPWAHITGAGLDGHIFVEFAAGSGSIPLHMVINSAAKLGAMSTPDSGGAARGAPAMCYAVFSPDTPDGAINDQLEKFEAELRAAIKTLIACADPSRDFNELRRARDLLEQARKAGAPV